MWRHIHCTAVDSCVTGFAATRSLLLIATLRQYYIRLLHIIHITSRVCTRAHFIGSRAPQPPLDACALPNLAPLSQ